MGPDDATLIRAWQQVTADIDAAPGALGALHPVWLEAYRAGSPRRELLAIHQGLGSDWRWPWFEEWLTRFTRDKRWPQTAPWAAFEEEERPPTRFADALPLFTVPELKSWAVSRGIDLTGAGKRLEVEAVIRKKAKWLDFEPAALVKFEVIAAKQAARRVLARCELLVWTLS